MKKLLSLPPNLVDCFHEITKYDRNEWFCTNDPVGRKLGSGGGTTWLLESCYAEHGGGRTFDEWLAADRRLILHAGGQSRRLPAYAPSGKVLTPVPVFRWERGQRLSQDLLSLQVPLYERIMGMAPDGMHTMIVSGDVYIRATQPLQPIPDADVVCYGLWLGPEIAKDHGVFVSKSDTPTVLECMMQKPSVKTLGGLLKDHFYLTDIGVWLLSDKAVKLLLARSKDNGGLKNYDLYSEFGCALGTDPSIRDEELNSLKVAVLPLPGGEFYHFGTSHEILSSTLAIQNLVNDQREIMHHSLKPHPAMFVQNAVTQTPITEANQNLWIENSWVGKGWTLAQENIITGVPENDWNITLDRGQCVDIVPVGETEYAVRPYGYDDKFRGKLADTATEYLFRRFAEWAEERGIDINAIEGNADLQSARIFPVCKTVEDAGLALRWMLTEPGLTEGKRIWTESRKMSADDLSANANLKKLFEQRRRLRALNWSALAKNHEHSVFYQVDLDDAAHEFAAFGIPEPAPISDNAPLLKRIHDSMFRSELARIRGEECQTAEDKAFTLLRDGLTVQALAEKQRPVMSVYSDQIVWARSPVRIDIAGTEESISHITADLLYKCYHTFYNLSNMVLCVAGGVTVADGGVLDVRGYVRGEGSVTAESGSTVYQPFIVYDYRGGTNTVSVYQVGKVIPFNTYDLFYNLQTNVTFEYGATATSYLDLYTATPKQHNTSKADLIGVENAFILMSEGSVVKTEWNASDDVLELDNHG